MLYQRDTLTVVSEVFRDFNFLLSTPISATESLKTFESRFAKINSNGSSNQRSDSLIALMLLSNSVIENSQRGACLADATPSVANLKSPT